MTNNSIFSFVFLLSLTKFDWKGKIQKKWAQKAQKRLQAPTMSTLTANQPDALLWSFFGVDLKVKNFSDFKIQF